MRSAQEHNFSDEVKIMVTSHSMLRFITVLDRYHTIFWVAVVKKQSLTCMRLETFITISRSEIYVFSKSSANQSALAGRFIKRSVCAFNCLKPGVLLILLNSHHKRSKPS